MPPRSCSPFSLFRELLITSDRFLLLVIHFLCSFPFFLSLSVCVSVCFSYVIKLSYSFLFLSLSLSNGSLLPSSLFHVFSLNFFPSLIYVPSLLSSFLYLISFPPMSCHFLAKIQVSQNQYETFSSIAYPSIAFLNSFIYLFIHFSPHSHSDAKMKGSLANAMFTPSLPSTPFHSGFKSAKVSVSSHPLCITPPYSRSRWNYLHHSRVKSSKG